MYRPRCRSGRGRTSTVRRQAQQGMVLVIVLWIVLGLVAVVLLFSEGMRMEYQASANSVSALEAEQSVEGARRYLTYVLSNLDTPGTVPTTDTFAAEEVPIDNTLFWLIGRSDEDVSSTDTPEFGFVDEAAKLNLNTATREMIEALPNMTTEVAAAIMDWRNPPNQAQPDGAQTEVYSTGTPAYECKNAPFESVGELRLVKGVTQALLYGADVNRNGILDTNETLSSEYGDLWRGLLDFVTVYTREPNKQADGSPRIDVRKANNPELRTLLQEKLNAARAAEIWTAVRPRATRIRSLLEFYNIGSITVDEAALIEDSLTAASGDFVPGLVNVNTAPREVLACIPGISEKYADALVTLRKTKTTDQLTSVTWILEVVDAESAVAAGPYLTTKTFQLSADVAAVGKGGRSLRRSRMVFDLTNTTPTLIYRCDETHLGWPLGSKLRSALDRQTTVAKESL